MGEFDIMRIVLPALAMLPRAKARGLLLVSLLMVSVGVMAKAPAKKPAAPAPSAAAGPVITIETEKGTIVFETFPVEAPKSVEHILALVKRHFYDGQAIHRVVPGQLAQFGDQQSRNAQLRDWWGRGANSGSGNPIGVAEISKKHPHKRGSVSLANPGTPASADSQLFLAMKAVPQWDGKYTVIGQVTSGLEVIPKLQVGDRIKKVTASSTP